MTSKLGMERPETCHPLGYPDLKMTPQKMAKIVHKCSWCLRCLGKCPKWTSSGHLQPGANPIDVELRDVLFSRDIPRCPNILLIS